MIRVGESWPARHGRRRWVSVGVPWPLLPLCLMWYCAFWALAGMLWLMVEPCVLIVSMAVAAIMLIDNYAPGGASRFMDVQLTRIGLGLFAVTLKGRP